MGDEDLANRVAALLEGRMIGTAESCTVGRVAEVLACVDNASTFLRGGVVAYQGARTEATCLGDPTDTEVPSAVPERSRTSCHLTPQMSTARAASVRAVVITWWTGTDSNGPWASRTSPGPY